MEISMARNTDPQHNIVPCENREPVSVGNDTRGQGAHATGIVGAFLFGSGMCALLYQMVWIRELRLVFGASTAASSAVLAIFMGGLGLGGAILGRRIDGNPRPLRFYGLLELMIAVAAALTPFGLMLSRQCYILSGGEASLGPVLAAGIRLLLSALVIGIPTFLMGGTLPAAAKAVERSGDTGRIRLARIYGINTIGAVTGVVGATFFMLEVFGTRNTLWMACLVNGLIGLMAIRFDRSPAVPAVSTGPAAGGAETTASPAAFPWRSLAFVAAALTGFVFFIMELAWYRMLGPILGGTTYTFGLILAVALLGIGIGGWGYSMRRPSSPATPELFALTVALEALFMAIPFALGDRLAVLAALLNPIGAMGLPAQAMGWAVIAGVVVFPAAAVSGFQFPLLISLLGRGEARVASDTGFVYAWNTAGSIAGAIAGGFGFIHFFSATGVWKGSVGLLCLLCLAVLWTARKKGFCPGRWVLPLAAAAGALGLLLATGPTAAWRHSPIGAGRTRLVHQTANEIKDWTHRQRRNIQWESDGVEGSVALDRADGLAFIVNGKVDGNAKYDAHTQVMLGLVGAALHPAPKRSLVIGLGTGSSAGWLARVDTMDRVDVVELEPDIRHVARVCAPVNAGVLDNPNVSITISDAREVLLTTRQTYDLIVSEPSNPYRAGIASLYTREFYQAVKGRMEPGAMFTQWVQGYEIDIQTLGTIYATLHSVFPFVETWQTNGRNIIFICSMTPPAHSIPRLRKRIADEPFRTALRFTWGCTDLEGFLARFVAGTGMAGRVTERSLGLGLLNTDDRMLIEFGFARSVGKIRGFSPNEIFETGQSLGLQRPAWAGSGVDWDRVMENRLIMIALDGNDPGVVAGLSPSLRHLAKAFRRFRSGDLKGCLASWQKSGLSPRYPSEMAMIAESMAEGGDAGAADLIDRLRPLWPLDAEAIQARLYFRTGAHQKAWASLESAFLRFRTDPWADGMVMRRAMRLGLDLLGQDPALGKTLFELFSTPFAVRVLDEDRWRLLLDIGRRIDFEHGARAVRLFEPHIPWVEPFLTYRALSYGKTGDRLAGQARSDLNRYRADARISFQNVFGK
jgi:spermidine synthase